MSKKFILILLAGFSFSQLQTTHVQAVYCATVKVYSKEGGPKYSFVYPDCFGDIDTARPGNSWVAITNTAHADSRLLAGEQNTMNVIPGNNFIGTGENVFYCQRDSKGNDSCSRTPFNVGKTIKQDAHIKNK